MNRRAGVLRFVLCCGCVMFLLVVTASLSYAASTKLRIAATSIKDDILTQPLDRWAEWVAQRTKGDVTPEVYYQSLGIEGQVLPSVVNGTVDVAQIVNGNLAPFTNAFMIYDLPFIFKKYDNSLDALVSPAGQELLARFEKDVNVKYLFAISNGMGRDVQTRPRQVKTPADLKGLKIRVLKSPVDLATFTAWGANPTPLEASQMYTALQQGVVDGVQQALTHVLTARYYEVLKYGVRIDYQAPVQIVYMNRKRFDSLPAEYQRVLLEEGQKAQAWSRERAARVAYEAVRELEGHGMVIYQPTADEYNMWTSQRERMWQEIADKVGTRLDINLARRIYAAQK